MLAMNIAFWGIVFLSALRKSVRQFWRSKSAGSWTVDIASLLTQGYGVMLLQSTLLLFVLERWAPDKKSILHIPALAQFIISFCGLDYVYYWNHRALHSRRLWPLHRLHHTVLDMDVFGTSRNTLWVNLLLVYWLLSGMFVFFVAEPGAFLLGSSLSAALDIWHHSPLHLPPRWRPFFKWLILPADHAAHHRRVNCNYGGSLSLWDRLHGTYHSMAIQPLRPAARQQPRLRDAWLSLIWPTP